MTRILSVTFCVVLGFGGVVGLGGHTLLGDFTGGVGLMALRKPPQPTSAADVALQQVRLAANHTLERGHGHLMVDGQLYSGMMIHRDISGMLIYSRYVSGLKNGSEVGYYPNGQTAFDRSWTQGKREGETVFWWSNGLMKSRSTYSNDVLSGPHSEWFSDGQQMRLFTYADGKEEGAQQMWYEDGSIRANYVVKSGKRYGSLGTKGCGLDDDSQPSTVAHGDEDV